MSGGPIDLRKWKRRDHYLWFRKYEQPFFSVTVDVDVTAAWNASRRRAAPSFFLTSLFLMLNAANAVEAFRLRLRPRGVWRHDRVAVGPTIMRPDETFGFVRLEPAGTLREFASRGRAVIAAAEGQSGLVSNRLAGDDIVFHSVLPWLRFTSVYQRAARQGRLDSAHRVRPVRARRQAHEDARVCRGASCARRRARRRPVLRTFRRQSRPRLTPFSQYGVAYPPHRFTRSCLCCRP